MTIQKAQTKDFFEEIGYRNGYTDGVADVIKLVSKNLSTSDKAKLADWQRQLIEWRGPIGALTSKESIDFTSPPELKEL
jgi:hypothetical protein